MSSTKITLEHFENGLIEFNDSNKFIEFVKEIYNENEEGSSIIPIPTTIESAKNYINIYCGNFKIIEDTMLYKAKLTITKPDNTTVELTILNDCEDCQKAIETLLNEATREPKDINDKIFNREPLLLLVDPDARNIMHLESMNMNLITYRKMTSPTTSDYVEYAKNNLMHLISADHKSKVTFVKALRSRFLNIDGSMRIGLKEAVDIFNSLQDRKYM